MKKIYLSLFCTLLLCCLCISCSAGAGFPFADVNKKDWYYGSVSYVYENGMMGGTSSTRFAPKETLTRAMFVTILGRLDGVKVNHKVATVFTDVKKGQYYTGYVKWGNDNGIVNGTSKTTFGPNENITREQMCALMVRYAKYAGVELKAVNKAVTFKDADKISGYAKTAVKTCQRAGLVGGEATEGGFIFRPAGNATRAEAAAIFERFDKTVKAQAVCPHASTKQIIDREATCGKDGLAHIVCTKCGETLQKNIILPATGEHTPVEEITTLIPATCGESGVGVKKCSVCGRTAESNIAIPATGAHPSFSETVEIAPDVFTDGVKQFTCDHPDCGYSYAEPILATGSLNETDRKKFSLALSALNGSEFKGAELVKYLYYVSFSITPAVSEEPDAVIEQIFIDPTGTNSQKYSSIVVPTLYGGKAVTESMAERLAKPKGESLTLSNMMEGDILCVLANAEEPKSAHFYATDGICLYDLTQGCNKLADASVLSAVADNDYYAVLRPSVASTARSSLRANPLYEGETDIEKAIIATAEAFLLRGDRMQYADTRLADTSPITYRWERGKSPEDYTDDETGYTNCTGFTHDVYLHALGFDYGSFNLKDAPEAMKAYTYFFTGNESDAQKTAIEKEYKEALEIGDIVFYTYSGNTHAMLYIGNGNMMHSTGNTYSDFKEAEEPAIRFMSLDVLFDPGNSSRYLFQTAKPRTALYIIRPLNMWEGGRLTEASKSRIAQMRGIFTEKTCSSTLGQTVNAGDTLTYTFTLRNTTDKAVSIDVTDTVPVGTVLMENGAPSDKKELSWTVALAPHEEKRISYTVKVEDHVTDGTAIVCTEDSKVGGIRTQCPAVYVGRTLTETEKATLKVIVSKKVGTVKSGVEMANEIYKELFGTDQVLGADIDALKAGLFLTNGNNKAIPTTGKYAEMIAPSLYGGKAVLNSPRFGGERTRLPREHNLIAGDILYLQGSSTSSGLYIYMGDGVMLDLSKGLNERDLSDRLQNTIGWQHFAILRPSLIINK